MNQINMIQRHKYFRKKNNKDYQKSSKVQCLLLLSSSGAPWVGFVLFVHGTKFSSTLQCFLSLGKSFQTRMLASAVSVPEGRLWKGDFWVTLGRWHLNCILRDCSYQCCDLRKRSSRSGVGWEGYKVGMNTWAEGEARRLESKGWRGA